MTKRRKRSTKKSSKKKGGGNKLLMLVLVLVLGGYFMVTGNDPLGLFESGDETDQPPLATLPPETGGDGDWWQVYFTNPQERESYDDLRGTPAEKLIAQINQAQSSIHIASFEFNLPQVAEALIAAQKRGVTVLWVTDDEHGIEADEDDGLELFAKMEEAGVGVRDDERSALMHNKFWIFDRQRVWTGSTNITVNGMFRNNNNVILLESPRVAAIYEREFEEMWGGEFGPTSPSTVDSQQTTVNGVPVQVLFAAEDEVATQLLPLIQNAKRQVRFMAFSFTHDALGQAVLDRANAGVDVRGIFEKRGSETEYSELPALFCAGMAMRQDGNPRTFHHKVFIIDEQTVATGSFNFSDNADESNDENVIIITDPALAAQYLQEFERRWPEGEEPDRADMGC